MNKHYKDIEMRNFVKVKLTAIKDRLGVDEYSHISLQTYVVERKKDCDYSPKENYYFNRLIEEELDD